MKKHFLGCKRDLFDKRDYEYLTNNTLTSDLWTMRKVE